MKLLLRSLLAASLLVQPLAMNAQAPDFTKGYSFFPNMLNPYRAMEVAAPEMSNSERINQLIREGKIDRKSVV